MLPNHDKGKGQFRGLSRASTPSKEASKKAGALEETLRILGLAVLSLLRPLDSILHLPGFRVWGLGFRAERVLRAGGNRQLLATFAMGEIPSWPFKPS